MSLDEQLLDAVSVAMEEPLVHRTSNGSPASSGHPLTEDAGEQPLPQWLNKLFEETEELLGEVAGPAYRFLSKEDVMNGLGIDYDDVLLMAQIGTRLQLIASNIDARQAPTLKVIRNG